MCCNPPAARSCCPAEDWNGHEKVYRGRREGNAVFIDWAVKSLGGTGLGGLSHNPQQTHTHFSPPLRPRDRDSQGQFHMGEGGGGERGGEADGRWEKWGEEKNEGKEKKMERDELLWKPLLTESLFEIGLAEQIHLHFINESIHTDSQTQCRSPALLKFWLFFSSFKSHKSHTVSIWIDKQYL